MTARRPRPLCAICADREATTITDWECASGRTRTIVACWPCLSPVPDPPEAYEPADAIDPLRVADRRCASTDHVTAETLIAAVSRLGRPTFGELIDHLGVTNHRANTLRATVRRNLTRLQARGVVSATPINPAHRQAGCRYEVARAA